MPTQALLTEAFKIQQAKLITLLEINISDAVVLRYASHESDVSWFTYTGSAWQAANYTAYPIKIDTVGQQSTDGKIESQSITITNVDKTIGNYIRQNDIRGNKVFITGVLEGLTSNANDRVYRWKYRISNARINKQDAVIAVQSYYEETMSEVPVHLRNRGECGWEFDSDGSNPIAAETCGFYTKYYSLGGTLNPDYPRASATSCDKGINTKNGCSAHFNRLDALKPRLRAQADPGISLKPVSRITI